jgi:hypothetical protein
MKNVWLVYTSPACYFYREGAPIRFPGSCRISDLRLSFSEPHIYLIATKQAAAIELTITQIFSSVYLLVLTRLFTCRTAMLTRNPQEPARSRQTASSNYQ